MADAVKIDVDSFTLDEIDEIEDLAGQSYATVFQTAAGLKAAYYIAKRREDPSFSWADAGKVTFGEITAGIGDDPDPTTAAVD